MTQSDAEILRKGYEDFAAGDVPSVLAVFSEDITWHVPGRNPISGDYTGHDEVVAFSGRSASAPAGRGAATSDHRALASVGLWRSTSTSLATSRRRARGHANAGRS